MQKDARKPICIHELHKGINAEEIVIVVLALLVAVAD